MSNGNKYNRTIQDVVMAAKVTVDVYSVLVAFDVQCPARQHAIKKLLCAGLRGKGNALQDLQEARIAVERAVGLEYQRCENSVHISDSKKTAKCRYCGNFMGQNNRCPSQHGSLLCESEIDVHIDL